MAPDRERAPEKDLVARLGNRFEARAVSVGERIEVRGIEPRLTPLLPAIVEVGSSGFAVVVRAGAVVFFGVDLALEERFISDLGARIHDRYDKREIERAVIRIGEADGVEPDGLTFSKITLDRLQVVAEILGKSVILARHELEIAEVFNAIEPKAVQMKAMPTRLPWKQSELVRVVGEAMHVEHQLVGRAELLEKPDLLWDNAELGRFYTRLEDEYEIRERHLVVDTKLTVVSRAAQTMLDLSQTRRSLTIEYLVLALIVLEVVLAIFELVR